MADMRDLASKLTKIEYHLNAYQFYSLSSPHPSRKPHFPKAYQPLFDMWKWQIPFIESVLNAVESRVKPLPATADQKRNIAEVMILLQSFLHPEAARLTEVQKRLLLTMPLSEIIDTMKHEEVEDEAERNVVVDDVEKSTQTEAPMTRDSVVTDEVPIKIMADEVPIKIMAEELPIEKMKEPEPEPEPEPTKPIVKEAGKMVVLKREVVEMDLHPSGTVSPFTSAPVSGTSRLSTFETPRPDTPVPDGQLCWMCAEIEKNAEKLELYIPAPTVFSAMRRRLEPGKEENLKELRNYLHKMVGQHGLLDRISKYPVQKEVEEEGKKKRHGVGCWECEAASIDFLARTLIPELTDALKLVNTAHIDEKRTAKILMDGRALQRRYKALNARAKFPDFVAEEIQKEREEYQKRVQDAKRKADGSSTEGGEGPAAKKKSSM